VTRREALDGLFDAWKKGDALRSAAHFAIEGVYREAGREPIVGRETIVEGDRAAVRYRFRIEGPASRWRETDGCAFVIFADGTIAEWREYGG
jgi:ketosteroid isomerase-like protein